LASNPEVPEKTDEANRWANTSRARTLVSGLPAVHILNEIDGWLMQARDVPARLGQAVDGAPPQLARIGILSVFSVPSLLKMKPPHFS